MNTRDIVDGLSLRYKYLHFVMPHNRFGVAILGKFFKGEELEYSVFIPFSQLLRQKGWAGMMRVVRAKIEMARRVSERTTKPDGAFLFHYDPGLYGRKDGKGEVSLEELKEIDEEIDV